MSHSPADSPGNRALYGLLLFRLAQGKEDSQIAAELHMGADTVKKHVGRVRLALGAVNRQNMVAIGYQRGLLFPGQTQPQAFPECVCVKCTKTLLEHNWSSLP